jgi:hypothetical protein
MSLTSEEVLFQLGRLVAELPDLAAGPITPETKAWLERADPLVQAAGGLADTIQFRVAIENLLHGVISIGSKASVRAPVARRQDLSRCLHRPRWPDRTPGTETQGLGSDSWEGSSRSSRADSTR